MKHNLTFGHQIISKEQYASRLLYQNISGLGLSNEARILKIAAFTKI